MRNILFICDIDSLWKACRAKYGPGTRINFEVLKDVVKVLHGDDVQITSTALMVIHPHKYTGTAFMDVLRTLDYRIIAKTLKYAPGIEGAAPSDWMCGITLMVLQQQEYFDGFVLAAGDKDYTELLKAVPMTYLTFETDHIKALFANEDLGCSSVKYLSKEIVYK